MKRLILVIIILLQLIWVPVLKAAMYLNGSPCAFENSCEDGTSSGTSQDVNHNSGQTLEQLIADGGTYFLQTLSDVDLLLSQVEAGEVTGVNFE
ncbi:MAG: hypothetical protein GY950_17945, partial [bacterium]|nr:hypothetical protein [bacterium]